MESQDTSTVARKRANGNAASYDGPARLRGPLYTQREQQLIEQHFTSAMFSNNENTKQYACQLWLALQASDPYSSTSFTQQ